VYVSGQAQYTYGRVLEETGKKNPLDHIPPFMMMQRTVFRGQKAHFSVDVLHNGWKRLKDYSSSGEDNLQYATPRGMPAWTLVHLRGSYHFGSQWRVQCALENLFDIRYRAFASGINGSGRNLVLELRYGL
jgi:hemoglobin/transferrin/lactoferrin receptor protein